MPIAPNRSIPHHSKPYPIPRAKSAPPREEQSSNGKPFAKLYATCGLTLDDSGSENVQAECPFCGKDRFYVNVATGEYVCHHANTCGKSGNAYTFIQWFYEQQLRSTTDQDYHALRGKRQLPLQTFKRHGLAWYQEGNCWLIPYKNKESRVVNLTRYFLDSGKKFTLPALPLCLYGVDKLGTKANTTLFICEGPCDAIALDHHLCSNKTRARYDILAVPSANVFKEKWLKYLDGRTIRLCFDNDKAGQDGQERIAKMVKDKRLDCNLIALSWPADYPEKCDISDLVKDGENIVEFTRKNCNAHKGERRLLFTRGDKINSAKMEWMDARHIPFDTFASMAGIRGTHKSDVARHLAACGTAGLPMPGSGEALPPFGVLIMTSEDSENHVRDLVSLAGGDLTKLYVHDIAKTDDPVDILDCLGEVEGYIKEYGARLVILDALNSFVGGDISSDQKARRTLSGRLLHLARKTHACVLGLRNWGKSIEGPSSSKVLGATSLSDVARCTMNTIECPRLERGEAGLAETPMFRLEFERVSGTAPPKPLTFQIRDLSTCKEDSHLRTINWLPTEQELKAALSQPRKGGNK